MTIDQLIEQFGEQHVVAFALVLARVAPLFALAPLFSSKLVPARVRGIVAVALAVGISPVVGPKRQIPIDAWQLTGLIGKELLVGLAFAFALGALFAAVSAAGTFLDTLIGFSFGAQVDPVNGNQSTVLSQLYGLVGVLVFIVIGGDAWVVQGLAKTYDVVPLLRYPDVGALVAGVDHAFVQIFLAAIEVSGPVVLALVLTDAAFGVVSRVVPQLNVFAVGFPAKVAVGVLLIGVTMPFVAGWLADQLQLSVDSALHTLKAA